MNSENFAACYIAWAADAIRVRIVFPYTSLKTDPLAFEKGDAVELFIDTKNLKNVKTTHRFIHHFCFFPERIDGVWGKEITRFRTEDRHLLADPAALEVNVVQENKKSFFDIRIPSKCLHGYVGEANTAIGFTYRIRSIERGVQTYGGSTAIFDAPYLWPSLILREKI